MGQLKKRVNRLLERTTGYRLMQGGRTLTGMVEQFSKGEVNGWLAVTPGSDPVRVTLHLNGQEVAATWVTDTVTNRHAAGEVRRFNFRLHDIWDYAKKHHKLTVRADGSILPINGHGMYRRPWADGEHGLPLLKAKLAAGRVFGQTGRLQVSKKLDKVWQARVMGLYGQVREIVKEKFGHDVFFVYGTLLGAVREGSVIGHDVDFDAAYISQHTDGKLAAEELQQIAFLLIERGLDVECKRTALHIHDADNPATRIDLFHLYFNDTGNLQFPFGVAGTTEVSTSDWQGTKEIEFCGGRGLLPVNSEQMAEHIYGESWRHPKPGFKWSRDRTKRDEAGVMPLSYGEEVYWSNFYTRMEFKSGSTFFEAVNTRPDMPANVIDIGCGDGRDSYAFGTAGRTVLGMDRSQVGVRHASKKAADMGLSERVRFAACDVSDVAALRENLTAAIAAADGPVLFYMRFFLHSITEEVQEGLLTAISECSRAGDMLAAEFRTDKDEALDKTYGKHFRRYQNGPAFGVALGDQYGFKPLDEQEGTGLSPYKDEDPELYRVVAQRG
ncbi:MAG: class I SAM-dependent methyltransferase [Actinocatenispora sp.]